MAKAYLLEAKRIFNLGSVVFLVAGLLSACSTTTNTSNEAPEAMEPQRSQVTPMPESLAPPAPVAQPAPTGMRAGTIGRVAMPPVTMPVSAESYAELDENTFKVVREAPLSTFSIDVDTASFSNVRRFLNQGQWPQEDAVRVEELVNYFDYAYAPPEDATTPFATHVELVTCPWNEKHRLARIGLKGFTQPEATRPAGNYVFLVDVSGSMSAANKLPLVQESLKTLLTQLGAEDRVGIVTYASGTNTPLASTGCDQKEKIREAIDQLQAGGSTHGSAGIRVAYEMARKNFIEGGINRVVLATDGDFNVGTTGLDELKALIKQEAESNVFLTVLGFGMGNYKDDRLEMLANEGNGNYAYIDSFREVRRFLGDKLTSTLMTIAKDVKIQVEFNPERVAAYRLIGYENRMLEARDFNDDTKDAGEIGAGHTVTAIYEFEPAGEQADSQMDPLRYQPREEVLKEERSPYADEWFLLKLRYKEPEGDASMLVQTPVDQDIVDLQHATEDTRLAAGVAAFGMVLRDSPNKGSATLDMAQELVESASRHQDEARKELLDMIVTAKTLQE